MNRGDVRLKPQQLDSTELTAPKPNQAGVDPEPWPEAGSTATGQTPSSLGRVRSLNDTGEAAPSEIEPLGANRERELIEAARRDPERFAELYEDNFARVYGYIARRVRDRAAAEDLTADVFHHALRNLGSYEWRGVPFGAWLIRIAANAVIDRFKRAAKEQEVLTASQVQPAHLDVSASLEADLEEVEHWTRLVRLVDALPGDQRLVIKLRFVEEKSIREIARELGRTEGAVKQLQFRGLQNLRAGMTKE
jgi:RNA polymerase sigma-70 factor (ECF subfamily)